MIRAEDYQVRAFLLTIMVSLHLAVVVPGELTLRNHFFLKKNVVTVYVEYVKFLASSCLRIEP